MPQDGCASRFGTRTASVRVLNRENAASYVLAVRRMANAPASTSRTRTSAVHVCDSTPPPPLTSDLGNASTSTKYPPAASSSRVAQAPLLVPSGLLDDRARHTQVTYIHPNVAQELAPGGLDVVDHTARVHALKGILLLHQHGHRGGAFGSGGSLWVWGASNEVPLD